MNTYFRTIFYLLLLLMFLCPAAMQAQENNSDTASVTDSAAVVAAPEQDSTTYEDTAYADTKEKDETLYFLRKEDTTSLYDSAVLQFRKVPDSTIAALKNDDAFWYANKDMQKKEEKPASDSWGDRFIYFLVRLFADPLFFHIIQLLVIGGILFIIILFIVQNKMNVFGATKGAAIHRERPDGEIDNIFNTDLKAEIEKAVQKENYRLAIRLSYLHLLKVFSQNDMIEYRTDATNMEYMTQLYTQPYYKNFFQVTRDYEYAWYGEVDVNRAQYDAVQREFSDLYLKTGLIY